MHDVAVKRRLVILVIAAFLSVAAASVSLTAIADDANALGHNDLRGGDGNDNLALIVPGEGDDNALRGGGDNDELHELAINALGGDDVVLGH